VTDGQQILAGFDREGFEAALIDMTRSNRVPMMLVPPLRMREGKPIYEAREISATHNRQHDRQRKKSEG
jgi:hypothetical protein